MARRVAEQRASTSSFLDVLGVLSLFVLPWSAFLYDRGPATLLFAWGLLSPASLHITDVYSYFFVYTRGLPDWVVVWPVGIVCLVFALISAGRGLIRGREDLRVTGGLLALVGVAALLVSLGFSGQPGRVGIPIGAAVAWVLAGSYWLRLRTR